MAVNEAAHRGLIHMMMNLPVLVLEPPELVAPTRDGNSRAFAERYHQRCSGRGHAAFAPAASISAREASPLGLITVAATPAEMERLRAEVERYDTPAQSLCDVQLTVPKAVKVSAVLSQAIPDSFAV
jgi:hypothetical protein